MMEELALKPLKRHRNKKQLSMLIDDDWDEVQTLISDEDDDQVNSKSAYQRRWRYQSCPKRIFEWTFNGGWKITAANVLTAIWHLVRKQQEPESRTVKIGQPDGKKKYPPNVTRNQKYSLLSFLPLVLFEQFKFFLNFYFLMIAITQFIPSLRIGALYTYWAPLGFVLLVTMSREAYDDMKRYFRDRDANSQKYTKLTANGTVVIASSDIKVSDVITVMKDQKVPADMILLRTTEKNGSCFVRTDQLDGETDWKLRMAVPSCQQLQSDQDLLKTSSTIWAEKPHKDIYSFTGKFSCTLPGGEQKEEPLGVENTLWANTIVASGTAVGMVIYTGNETRSVMNTSSPKSKIGLVDQEINNLTKLLFVGTLVLSAILTFINIRKGFSEEWQVTLIRFILLFSYIIPISLRVNLDMGKLVYTWVIMRDKGIPDTVVRNSTIPEELGRVEYLMTDKTGTLTQNEMVFKKLCLGQQTYTDDNMDELRSFLSQIYPPSATTPQYSKESQMKQNLQEKIHGSVLALAVCHNVTPVMEEEQSSLKCEDDEEIVLYDNTTAQSPKPIRYQASSPDEVALVKWTESVGMALVHRELNSMQIKIQNGHILSYSILQIFPFKSETKRMGIILQDNVSKEIVFFMKGADTVMSEIVRHNEWLEEECDTMAREGLRTLVTGAKTLTLEEYEEFEKRYQQAKLSMTDRQAKVDMIVQSLERDLELLCITGVEDQLQVDVRPTLELLRNAGIKIWMLTGDKLETATSIAISSRLVSRAQTIYTFKQVSNRREVQSELHNLRKKSNCALIISGKDLEVSLTYAETELIELACKCPVVVCCRCTPTHKEKVVQLMKTYTKKPTCAVGDGGNDVSMIQAADVGIGIVGKEGNQASLAADFSITQFSHLGRLLMWHGRNSYKRSASLSQFVMHRGLIISTMQAIFSIFNKIAADSLYQGILMIGYTTLYTMAPVFSLVWDEDVSVKTALTFPELYKDLMKGKSLSFKSFLLWVMISVYQGAAIMGGSYLLFKSHDEHIVSTFTALLLTEFVMVALTIHTWHWIMLLAELFSVIVYFGSLFLLDNFFDVDIDVQFLFSFNFVWKTLLLTSCSCVPLVIMAVYRRCYAPPAYTKLMPRNSMLRNCLCTCCIEDH